MPPKICNRWHLMHTFTPKILNLKVIYHDFLSVMSEIYLMGVRGRPVHISIDFSLIGSQSNCLCMQAHAVSFGLGIKEKENFAKMYALKT